MIRDKNDANYFRTTASGQYKLYFFPRAPKQGVTTVVQLDVLDHVSCSGTAAGYGSKGQTVIKVAMWGWSRARLDVAEKLWMLHNKGCKVEVFLNSGKTNWRVRSALLSRSAKYCVMPVHDSWIDGNYNGYASLYMHHKALMINGVWYGDTKTKVTYTGSQNFTGSGQLANDDIILRVKDDATYDAYHKHLSDVRNHSPRLWW